VGEKMTTCRNEEGAHLDRALGGIGGYEENTMVIQPAITIRLEE
jgi:hypothetical protein